MTQVLYMRCSCPATSADAACICASQYDWWWNMQVCESGEWHVRLIESSPVLEEPHSEGGWMPRRSRVEPGRKLLLLESLLCRS
eukprot:747078-Hanusia_phi.AAC.1